MRTAGGRYSATDAADGHSDFCQRVFFRVYIEVETLNCFTLLF